MDKGGGSSPAPIDLTGAANAQGRNNVLASIIQSMLSHTNQSTPLGSINWSQTGSTPVGLNGVSPGMAPSTGMMRGDSAPGLGYSGGPVPVPSEPQGQGTGLLKGWNPGAPDDGRYHADFNLGRTLGNIVDPIGSLIGHETGLPSVGGGISQGVNTLTNDLTGGGGSALHSRINGILGATGSSDPTINVPQFSSNVTLSPVAQALFNSMMSGQQGSSDTSNEILNANRGDLSSPLGVPDVQGVQDSLYSRGAQYLDPQFSRLEDQERTRLANQGFQVGTEGFNKAMTQFGDTRQKAYSDLREGAITGAGSEQSRLLSNAMMKKQFPVSLINALRSGGSLPTPQFMPPSGPGVSPAPTFDAATGQISQNIGLANLQNAQQAQRLQGLLGMGSLGLLGAMAFA